MTPQPHVIGRQILDLKVGAGSDVFALQKEVGELFHTHVVPAMAALFDRYNEPDIVVRIDRIEIDIGHLVRDQLGESFAAKVCDALEIELAASLAAVSRAGSEPRDGSERWSKEEHALTLWHYVLLHGYLPWWASAATAADLEMRVDQILASRDALPDMTTKMFRTNPGAVHRFVLQGSETLLKRVLQLLNKALAVVSLPVLDAIQRLLEEHSLASLQDELFRRSFWEAALTECLNPTTRETNTQLVNMLRRALQSTVGESSVTYGELLAHIRGFVEPLAASARPTIPGAVRRTLAPVLSTLAESVNPSQVAREGGALEIIPSADRGSTREALAMHSDPKIKRASPLRDVTQANGASLPRNGETTRGDSNEEDILQPRNRARARDIAKKEKKRDAPPLQKELHQDVDRSRADCTHDDASESVTKDRDATSVSGDRPLHDGAKADLSEGGNASTSVRDNHFEALSTGAPVSANERREVQSPPVIRDGEALYVNDAGIVLLHPFLQMHFEKLGLVRENEFVDERARERAVHQLHFLVTGEEQSQEYVLVLSKIVCGLTPDVPIARLVAVDELAKSEAEKLLQAVIRHWGALKNASPDGLRETFLRREGRLTRKTDWRLQVESRSYDLLLDRLPWTRSIIRLPWMPELLRVEWA
ncbi:MAG: hypothetical protein DHS20C01_31170 [marine bacterium B5-7]|nr:MAG: hypothetical protein DHS20C01_31170 [marine bacterium B5-7]